MKIINKFTGLMSKRFAERTTMQLQHRYIFIVPTLYLFMLFLVLVLLWVISVQFLINLGFMLVFLLIGVIIISMIQTYRNLDGLTIQVDEFTPSFAQETTTLRVELGNPTAIVKKEIILSLDEKEVIVSSITQNESTKATIPYVAKKRGWEKIARIKISSVIPMGFFIAWSYFKPAKKLLVFPKPIFTEFPPSIYEIGEDRGEHEIEGKENIVGVREYQQGDALNLLSWKHLIQQDKWISKMTSQSTGGQSNFFDWQQTTSSFDYESKISQLCGWILMSYRNQDSFGIGLPNTKTQVDSGHAHLYQCLAALATM